MKLFDNPKEQMEYNEIFIIHDYNYDSRPWTHATFPWFAILSPIA